MKVLVSGGKGLLGRNILPVLAERFDIAVYDIDEWDITCASAGSELMKRHKPDVVLNLAAMTDVDGCEDKPLLAEKINTVAAGTVAGLCADTGARLIHMSTDYVFDGKKGVPYREDDIPGPVSVYGQTKLDGERMVFEKLSSATVVRTQWLYGKGGSNFVDTITQIARQQGSVGVVDDQRGSPTYAKDLAIPMTAIIEKGLTGIFHITNSGYCSWYEFAKAIFSCQGMDVQVNPITSGQLGRRAARPAYGVLDISKIERVCGIRMRHWMEALKDYLECTG